jgi:ABC-2 type transport system ATP-binding protein
MAPRSTQDGPAVEVAGLTKTYGRHRVVDDLTFAIGRGRVTGFLGPNGAGKTTTLRMLLGLAEPTAGQALVLGRPFGQLEQPARRVGALLDASGFHPGRRACDELAIHAAAGGLDGGRVEEVLAEVGLDGAARKRIAQLSLGMRQRLGLAAALLGRPDVLVLDEPANGLDPAGIHWLRDLLRDQAARGAAVLVSSHVLSELALFAEDVVVLHRGRLVVQSSIAELTASGGDRVFVTSPDPRLPQLLAACGGLVTETDGGFQVDGLRADVIGEAAARSAIPLHQLRTEVRTLEEIFLGITTDDGGIR